MKEGIAVVIPTLNGGSVFTRSLEMIFRQDYDGPVQVVVIDSGSVDGTAEVAEEKGVTVRRIRKESFHHARTRNEALTLTNFDRVVFLVQDAVPVSTTWLNDLRTALDTSGAAAVYTDQVPHEWATLHARFETESISRGRGGDPVLWQLDSLESFHRMPYHEAYRAINLDNVCAIYQKKLLLDMPFPEVDFAEDMAWALQMLLEGHKIFYQPGIKVKHSHDRPPLYGFRRQIINSIWSAKIMNRVEKDFSGLNVFDLLALAQSLRKYVEGLDSDICKAVAPAESRSVRFETPVDRKVRVASLINWMRWFISRRGFGEQEQVFLKRNLVATNAMMVIRHNLEFIRERYQPLNENDVMDALQKMLVNILGRIFGETYASYMIKGNVPAGVRRLMRPFMQGV